MNYISIKIDSNVINDLDLDLRVVKNHYIFNANFIKINKIKNKIENYLYSWDKNKKYTNPYEKVSKSSIRPISRSFFKLLEIINIFDLIDKKKDKYIFFFFF